MANVAQPQLLSVQQAVRAAVNALPTFLAADPPALVKGVRVEEVFRPDDQHDVWRITLSHLEPGAEKPKDPLRSNILAAPPPKAVRVYHVFDVQPETGEVLTMRLRERPR